jgi:hypothetical protein
MNLPPRSAAPRRAARSVTRSVILPTLRGIRVFALRGLAQRYYSEGKGLLTQRKRADLPAARGGACFEYWFTKARAADG